MPQATNLVIKNGAGTDKTFVVVTPAAGDGGVAEWALPEGPISAAFPRFTASATKRPDSRNLKTKLRLASTYNDAVTGLTNVSSAAEFNASVTVPANFPEDKKDDFVAYATNVFQTVLLRAMVRDAYPAT